MTAGDGAGGGDGLAVVTKGIVNVDALNVSKAVCSEEKQLVIVTPFGINTW